MQKRKKQLLGLAGLVLVGAMTAVACAMPTPGASAEGQDGSGVNITVTVKEGGDEPGPDDPSGRTSVSIVAVDGKPVSGTVITTKRELQVKLDYTRADSIVLQVKNSKGEVVGSASCADMSAFSGTCVATVKLDKKYLAQDPQNGDELTIFAEARRSTNGAIGDDMVKFIYRSAYIYSKGEVEDKTYNPIIYGVLNSDVKYAEVHVFDASGKEVVFDKPITFSYADVDPVTGEYKIVLPFKENNLPAGKYTAILMAYSTATPSEDSLVSVSTIKDIIYSPDGSPLPPDTGSNLFQNLNISRVDYLITGLIAFGMVTVFAVFLIVRRNKR